MYIKTLPLHVQPSNLGVHRVLQGLNTNIKPHLAGVKAVHWNGGRKRCVRERQNIVVYNLASNTSISPAYRANDSPASAVLCNS